MKAKVQKHGLINALRLEVKRHLSHCVPSKTPKICKRISTLEGYQAIEDIIINLAIRDQVSLGTAILSIETDIL